jgi:F-type H+-transporting ATPase subunit delta
VVKGSLAKRYARALMAIGQEQGVYERLGKEMTVFSALVEQTRDLRLVLQTPSFSRETRDVIISKVSAVMGAHEVTVHFLKLLNEKHRLAYIAKIAAAFSDLADEAEGRVRAKVISAATLSSKSENHLRDTLADLTGKQVLMEQSVDPDLIGGIITRVSGLLLDGSLRTQLKTMEDKLKQVGEV